MDLNFKADGNILDFRLKVRWRKILAIVGVVGVLSKAPEIMHLWQLLHR